MGRDWRWVFTLVCCWSCAGDLKDPDRFDFLLDGGPKSGTGSAATGGRTGGGTGASGTGSAGRTGGTGASTGGGTSGGRAGTSASDAGVDSGPNPMGGGTGAAGANGANGGNGGGGAATGTPDCVKKIFTDVCAVSGCHGANAQTVVLTPDDGLQARLVGKESAACDGSTYISTDGNPSYLVEKINDDPPCGQKMPFGTPLTATETTCITNWVNTLSEGN